MEGYPSPFFVLLAIMLIIIVIGGLIKGSWPQ